MFSNEKFKFTCFIVHCCDNVEHTGEWKKSALQTVDEALENTVFAFNTLK